MKIKIKYLKFHNFLSFEDGEVDFNTSGYTLVQGINKNVSDMAVSNGSGKSSIFEALSWCLTGELIRGSKNVKRLNSNEKDNCWVSLEFDIDDKHYEVCRYSNPSKLQFIVNGENVSGKGIRDTEKILQEYLPNLNSSLIGSVIILGQGLPQRFSNNTPSGRKEVLETLSNSDVMLYDLKDRISKRSSELSDKERKLEDDLLKTTTQKEMFERDIPLLEKELDNLPDVEKLESTITNLNMSLSTIQKKLEDNDALLVSLKEKENKLTNQVIELRQEYEDSIKKETSSFSNILDDLHNNKIEYQTLVKSKNQEIIRLKNIKDTCPTCGQKLPGVEKVDTSSLESEIQDLKNKIEDIEIKESEINNKITNITLIIQNDFESKIYEVNIKLNEISNQSSNINKENVALNIDIRNILAELSKLETQKSNRETYKNTLEEKIQSIKHSIEECASKILYINNNKEELQRHIDIIQKMKTVITRDFRGYLLSSVINFINKKAKEYSQEVFETDKINFSLEGNNIDISYDNKEYSNLSGGERQKVDLIIQFALRDMLCKYLDFSSNIIVVDELFDNLDSVGCEKILNFISNKLTDVENIYIITHHADIPIPFDNILTVIKGEDGISRIN